MVESKVAPKKLPISGKSFEEVQRIKAEVRDRLINLPGVIGDKGIGYVDTRRSRRYVFDLGIDPNLTLEQIAKLPKTTHRIPLRYSPYDYFPTAGPAYPAKERESILSV